MHPMGNAREHFWLTIGMSKAVGVDLGEMLKTGRLSHDRYASMVSACRTCDEPEACQALLGRATRLDQPPAYCRNRALLAALGETA